MARADTIDTDASSAVLTDRAPLHGEAARQLDDGRLGRVVHGREQALVGNQPAHARDQADAAVAFVLEHLSRCRRRRHHHPRVVHRYHLCDVPLRVLHGWRELLYTALSQLFLFLGDLSMTPELLIIFQAHKGLLLTKKSALKTC